MESRMEKYYRENPEYYKRSKRNADLYKDIDNNINDLENLPIPDNSNEIDINGLKQIISSRDEYRKAKDMGRTITRKRVEEEPREEKRRVYDINVLLETAKNEVNKNIRINVYIIFLLMFIFLLSKNNRYNPIESIPHDTFGAFDMSDANTVFVIPVR